MSYLSEQDFIDLEEKVTLQPIGTAPIGEGAEDIDSWFIGYKIDGYNNNKPLVETCYRNSYGVFSWFGGNFNATHWMHLPSRPVDKETR